MAIKIFQNVPPLLKFNLHKLNHSFNCKRCEHPHTLIAREVKVMYRRQVIKIPSHNVNKSGKVYRLY